MGKRSKKNHNASMWDSDTVGSAASTVDESFAENPQAPSMSSGLSKRKWLRRGLFFMVFVATPLTFVLWLSIALETEPPPAPDTIDSVEANSSAGKSVAYSAVLAWLNSDPQPLPGGTLVSWDGYELLKPNAELASTSDEPVHTSEIHYFTLVTGEGAELQYFSTSVEVLIDPILGAKVNSPPTLLPRVPSAESGWQSGPAWDGFAPTNTPTAVTESVAAWATAFTSGKPEALRLAVGDPSDGHAYMPLSGVTSVSSSIQAAAALLSSQPSEEAPSTLLVRVELALGWAGNDKDMPVVTYDVLVENADTASPTVVAWGGPGSGPELTRYGNAVTGVSIEPIEPSAAPEASAINESEDASMETGTEEASDGE